MAYLTSGTNPITELGPNPQVLPEVREISQFEQRSWQCLASCHNSSSENNYKSQVGDAYKVPVRTHQVRFCAFSASYFCTQRAVISQPIDCSFFYTEKKTIQLLVKKHSVPYICLPKDSKNPGEMQQLIFTNQEFFSAGLQRKEREG